MVGILVLVVSSVVSGVIGALIGRTKGRPGLGLMLGLILGFIGWIIVAVLPRTVEQEARRNLQVRDAMTGLELAHSGYFAAARVPTAPPFDCQTCASEFVSRPQLLKHLADTGHG